MEIRMDNAKYMAECVKAVASLIEEANMEFTKEGLNILAMDNASIALVDFNIPKEAFSKYDAEDNEKLGVNFDNLNKILSRARDGESMTLKKDKEDKFTIIFSQGKSSRRYKINSIEMNKETKKLIPKAEVRFKINKNNLETDLKDANMISGFLNISISKEGFKVRARGDIGELDNECNPEIISDKEVKGTFNLEYLFAMIKGCDKDSDINITLANNEPISLSYNIGEAKLMFVLAPYMEE
jgi:proliferating cell nuclear antigen